MKPTRPKPALPAKVTLVPVWDPFVRLFHWSLASLFLFSFLTGDGWDRAHEWAGYAITALICSRVVWGLVGPRHARFADFLYHPAVVLGFLADSLHFRAPRYLGHNPAGGAMVVALLATVAVICGTGIMMGMDAFWGAAWVENLHVAATWTAIGLIVLHLVGVALASLEHKENLVRAMVTGLKRAVSRSDRPDAGPRKPTARGTGQRARSLPTDRRNS
jgi:cytochrome b